MNADLKIRCRVRLPFTIRGWPEEFAYSKFIMSLTSITSLQLDIVFFSRQEAM